jgi:hypothetical protein
MQAGQPLVGRNAGWRDAEKAKTSCSPHIPDAMGKTESFALLSGGVQNQLFWRVREFCIPSAADATISAASSAWRSESACRIEGDRQTGGRLN